MGDIVEVSDLLAEHSDSDTYEDENFYNLFDIKRIQSDVSPRS